MGLYTKTIKNFNKGLVNRIEAYSIQDGAYSAMENFATKGDKVELRRGTLLLGSEVTGNGEAYTFTAYKNDGTEVLYKIRDLKVEYYNTTTEDWVEVGTNILPSDVVLSDVTFNNYNSLSGAQIILASPKMLYMLIPDAPSGYIDLYNSTVNYKGYVNIENSRMKLWGRTDDPANFYLSWIDSLVEKIEASTGVIADEAIGALGSQNYTGTLAFKAGNAKAHCFAVQFIEAGGETFTDNRDGTLTGDAGGTGTIDYISGAYDITFNAVTSGAVTADYNFDDPTNDGIADFSYSATRVAGEGDVFLQGSGGDLKAVQHYNGVDYCFHEREIWKVTLGLDDTTATNIVYRKNVGVEHHRNAKATANGIYFIDSQGDKEFRLLQFSNSSVEVIPKTISDALNIDDYTFDKAVIFEFEDYVLFACRTQTNNNIVFAYNKVWDSWDRWQYFVGNFTKYDGTLHIGDSGSDNVYEILSGLDDDDSKIGGYVEFNLTNMELPNELKKVRHLIIQGAIGKEQKADVKASVDNGSFVKVGEIDGSGGYVDVGSPINVGSIIVGKNEIGGGGSGILAYNYIKKIRFNVGKFERAKIRIEPTELGWLDVSEIRFRDILRYEHKLPTRYR